jgi:hypothetical protein
MLRWAMPAILRVLLVLALSSALAGVSLAASLSGTARDDLGAPLAGVQVEAVYQSYRADQLNNSGASIKATAVTDAAGRYRIDLGPLPPGEYAANAFQVVLNGGREILVDLVPDDPAPFAGNTDTQRDFAALLVEQSEALPYGNGGIFVLNNAIGDFTDLSHAEVTLVDTVSGRTFVRPVRPSGEGLVVTGIPFGSYRASVTLAGQALRVALWGASDAELAPSVTHDFTMGYSGREFQVMARP